MSLIIYTKQNCPWCIDLIDFLNINGIEYEEREVRNNPQFMQEMIHKSGQTKAPTVDFNGKILPDTDVDAVKKLLQF